MTNLSRLSSGSSGSAGLDLRNPGGDAQCHQIALREVAVVMGPHLASDGDGDVAQLIEVTGLLHHFDVAALQILLAGYLVGESLFHALEAGDVLDLRPVSSFQRDVGVHAHGPFQGAVEDIQIFENALQLVQEGARFFGRAKIRLGHHFQKRHAAAVVVHHGVLRLVDGARMHQPPGVLLHMRPVDADISLQSIIPQDHDVALGSQGKIVLADLEALGEIRIVVVLAVEERLLLNGAVEGETHFYAALYGFPVQHGQGTGQT